MLENTCDLPVRVALALPGNDDHRRAVSRIRKALEALEIEVFWVGQDGAVTLEGLTRGFASSLRIIKERKMGDRKALGQKIKPRL
jgi:hypothetical protein